MSDRVSSTGTTYALGDLAEAVRGRLAAWEADAFAVRLWSEDHTLWSGEDVPELGDRLGWLWLPDDRGVLPELRELAESVRGGTDRVVLIGMGGSSLAPEVFASTFGNAPGYPPLTVMDSTHPGAVASLAQSLDLTRTLFVVASKSGGTIETLSLFRYFWSAVTDVSSSPGEHFVALTDPGSGLEALAQDRDFLRVFSTPPAVGGRYSALTPFGLLPAALLGMDLDRLMSSAAAMSALCGPTVSVADNPGLRLGAILGEASKAGRDKLTIHCSPSLVGFPAWLEQLVAESTGKQGTGIVPVASETLGDPEGYGPDRLFLFLTVASDGPEVWAGHSAALQALGHPVVSITIDDLYGLGGEIFRSELAVASAGSVLGINPFDQPDVQLAKDLARQALSVEGLDATITEVTTGSASLVSAVETWLGSVDPGHYVALQAFIPGSGPAAAGLNRLVSALRDRLGVAVTLGYGPRFLHSTGQLHKGGSANGNFLQVVGSPEADLPIPEADTSFGALLEGQAAGDFSALDLRERRLLRVRLVGDHEEAVADLSRTLLEAADGISR